MVAAFNAIIVQVAGANDQHVDAPRLQFRDGLEYQPMILVNPELIGQVVIPARESVLAFDGLFGGIVVHDAEAGIRLRYERQHVGARHAIHGCNAPKIIVCSLAAYDDCIRSRDPFENCPNLGIDIEPGNSSGKCKN